MGSGLTSPSAVVKHLAEMTNKIKVSPRATLIKRSLHCIAGNGRDIPGSKGNGLSVQAAARHTPREMFSAKSRSVWQSARARVQLTHIHDTAAPGHCHNVVVDETAGLLNTLQKANPRGGFP